MTNQFVKYRCRKCRLHLFDNVSVIPSHGSIGVCNKEDLSTLWYLNDEEILPDWVQQQINQSNWTKGKLICPKCHGRLGSYDYLSVNKCQCGGFSTPHIKVLRSRVDACQISHRGENNILPKEPTTDRDNNLNDLELIVRPAGDIFDTGSCMEFEHEKTAATTLGVVESDAVIYTTAQSDAVTYSTTDKVKYSSAQNDVTDITAQTDDVTYRTTQNDDVTFRSAQTDDVTFGTTQTDDVIYRLIQTDDVIVTTAQTDEVTYTTAQTDTASYSPAYVGSFHLHDADDVFQASNINNVQTQTDNSSYDGAHSALQTQIDHNSYSHANPRTHKSMLRQADPNVTNFIIKDSSTQTEEHIESVEYRIVRQDTQAANVSVTDNDFQEFQQLWEDIDLPDDSGIYGNELNAMQTNVIVQTRLTAVPMHRFTESGDRQSVTHTETGDHHPVTHPVTYPVTHLDNRQTMNRIRNRRRQEIRRRRKQLRRGNTYSLLRQDSDIMESESDTDSDSGPDISLLDSHCCPICLDVLFKPHRCLPCNHIFCDPCLRQLAHGHQLTTPCPLCRNIIRHVKFCKDLSKEVQETYPKDYIERRKAERRTLNSSYRLPGAPEMGFWSSMLSGQPPTSHRRSNMTFSQFGASAINPNSPNFNGFYDVPRGLTLLGVTLWMGICGFIVFICYAITVFLSSN